jgi:hypothetical protein
VWSPDVPDGVPFGHDVASLGDVRAWNLITPFVLPDLRRLLEER